MSKCSTTSWDHLNGKDYSQETKLDNLSRRQSRWSASRVTVTGVSILMLTCILPRNGRTSSLSLQGLRPRYLVSSSRLATWQMCKWIVGIVYACQRLSSKTWTSIQLRRSVMTIASLTDISTVSWSGSNREVPLWKWLNFRIRASIRSFLKRLVNISGRPRSSTIGSKGWDWQLKKRLQSERSSQQVQHSQLLKSRFSMCLRLHWRVWLKLSASLLKSFVHRKPRLNLMRSGSVWW